jgi:hypothetical protein
MRQCAALRSLLKHSPLLLAMARPIHQRATLQLARFAAAALHAASDEAVAREVVALLRQRGSYSPPSDGRLLRALQHQLDFLGLPGPQAVGGQEMLLVPSYILEQHVVEEEDTGDNLRLPSLVQNIN